MDDYDNQSSELFQKNEYLKRFQKIVNTRHPFGIRLWKPALYDKHRSIEGNTYYDLHSYPTDRLEWKVIFNPGNILWTLLFGWWIGLAYILVTVTLFLPLCLLAAFVAQGMDAWDMDESRLAYKVTQQLCLFGKCARHMIDAGIYFLWPFGRLVKIREHDISSFPNEQGGSALEAGYSPEHSIQDSNINDDENPTKYLLPFRNQTSEDSPIGIYNYEDKKVFMFIFRTIYATLLAPLNLLSAICCMFLIFFIPMTQLNIKITKILYHCPFATVFAQGKNVNYLPFPRSSCSSPLHRRHFNTSIESENLVNTVLCVKSAVGRHYYKHTIKGINVVFVNLTLVALYSLIDHYGISFLFGKPLSSDSIRFVTSLISTVPLAYFINMSVAFITSETASLALGAVVNATFGSIIEIILYVLAIINNEDKIVDGAILGSLLASLLALPGLSMMFGAIRIPEQKFSSKLAGITCTTLIGAVVSAFLPTLFQSIYGSYGIYCSQNPGNSPEIPPNFIDTSSKKIIKHQGCTITRERLDQDVVYNQNTTKLVHISSMILIIIYLVGLYFTLTSSGGKYLPKKISNISSQGFPNAEHASTSKQRKLESRGAHSGGASDNTMKGSKDSEKHSSKLHLEACTSGIVNTSEPNVQTNNSVTNIKNSSQNNSRVSSHKSSNVTRWCYYRNKSGSILRHLMVLLGCTIAHGFIAEIIVKTISNATMNINVSSKMLGLTIFALVPMTAEFYNAVSFAMNRNIALGLEIGSAYMAQVLMIQIPVLVLFSTYFYNSNQSENHNLVSLSLPRFSPNMGFTMIFSSWDMYVCLFGCLVFLRVYAEGKSNFFKGTVLFLTYIIIITSYLLIPKV